MRRLLACALIAFATPAIAATPPSSFSTVIEPLMPAVVNISTTQKVASAGLPGMPGFDLDALGDDPGSQQFKDMLRQFNQRFHGGEPQSREVTSLGSGFVIDPSGYIVTNSHVIREASEITVVFPDNTRLPAKIVGQDTQTDLALLKVSAAKPLTYVQFGSSDGMRVGDWVVAIGNPFGLGGSVSAGIISARGRNINAGPFDDFLQTDAAINRGNSGGPLFNMKGEVVGINSAIFSPNGGSIGIGFAVPADMAKPIIDQLRQFGRTHRGWLGVKIQEVSDEIAEALGLGKPRGALVLEISAGSPAVGSGLEVGDVIVAFNGRAITEMRQLPRMVAETKVGTRVELSVWRKGREVKLPVKLGEVKDDQANKGKKPEAPTTPEPPASAVLGMEVVPVTPELVARYQLPKAAKGLVVTKLNRNGDAAKQGVQLGDIITDVNQTAVTSVAALKAELKSAASKGRDHAMLRVERRDGAMFITVPVK